ncbi:MAG: hypothetical protein AMXMBFR42_04090 [Burkholderiales bacterium]
MRLLRLLLLVLSASTPAAGFAQAAAQPVIAQQISCRGEEPFWNLEAGRTSGVMQTLGGSKARQVVEYRGEILPLSFLAPAAIVWRGTSTHLPSQTVVATLREESCASTMKEGPPRPWRAILTSRPGEAVTGCCTVRSGFDAMKAPLAVFASKPESDWSRRWAEVAAAVQRCANDPSGTVREVTSAAPAAGGTVAVRGVASDGKAWTCTVDAAGKSQPRFAPATAEAPAGAGGPVFYPFRDPPPIVACGRLERIAGPGARARTEGWLHYERC